MHLVEFNFKVKSSALKILTPKSKHANFRFLYYTIDYIDYFIGSGTHSRQWISKFSQIKIPVPPIQEQNKIADILSTWDNAIELKENKIRYRKRLLNALIQRFN